LTSTHGSAQNGIGDRRASDDPDDPSGHPQRRQSEQFGERSAWLRTGLWPGTPAAGTRPGTSEVHGRYISGPQRAQALKWAQPSLGRKSAGRWMALTAWRRSSAREARGDDLAYGLDLDRAVATGGLDRFPDRPAGSRFNPPADRQGGEHDREAGFGQVALAVADGRTCRLVLDVRKLFSTFQRSWQLPMTKPRYELKAAAAFVTTRNALPQRPVRGRPWKRRRCAPTVRGHKSRPLCVRGHRDTAARSATR